MYITMQVVHLFVLPLALGSKALLLPHARSRELVLKAISALQTICYSVRSKRPYTLREHRHICRVIAKDFFSSLSSLRHQDRLTKITRAENYNIDKPPTKRRRVPYQRVTQPPFDESSDTASSSDGDQTQDFFRDDKIIPHIFVHLPEQVHMGGTHVFHDTVVPESSHAEYLKMSGARSRRYHKTSRTITSMMKFNKDLQLLEEICKQSQIGK